MNRIRAAAVMGLVCTGLSGCGGTGMYTVNKPGTTPDQVAADMAACDKGAPEPAGDANKRVPRQVINDQVGCLNGKGYHVIMLTPAQKKAMAGLTPDREKAFLDRMRSADAPDTVMP